MGRFFRIKIMRRLRGLVLVTALAGAALAQAPGARLFKLSGVVGSTSRIAIKTSMQAVGAAGGAGFEGTIDEKLLSAKSNETVWQLGFKVSKTHESGVMTGAAAGFKQLNGLVMKRFSDATGQTLKLMVGNMSVPSSGTPDLVFSKRPVKVGDSWESKVNVDGQAITVVYRLAQYGSFGKTPAAKITGTYKPGQIVRNLAPLVFWVDLKHGKTLSSTGRFRASKAGTNIDVSFELKRQG